MGKKRGRGGAKARDPLNEPPEGCHHYEDAYDVPWDIQKYHFRQSLTKYLLTPDIGTFTNGIKYSPNMMMVFG